MVVADDKKGDTTCVASETGWKTMPSVSLLVVS
jgi:hypothetical protein